MEDINEIEEIGIIMEIWDKKKKNERRWFRIKIQINIWSSRLRVRLGYVRPGAEDDGPRGATTGSTFHKQYNKQLCTDT